jgi:hypothetical protein
MTLDRLWQASIALALITLVLGPLLQLPTVLPFAAGLIMSGLTVLWVRRHWGAWGILDRASHVILCIGGVTFASVALLFSADPSVQGIGELGMCVSGTVAIAGFLFYLCAPLLMRPPRQEQPPSSGTGEATGRPPDSDPRPAKKG